MFWTLVTEHKFLYKYKIWKYARAIATETSVGNNQMN